MPPGVLWISSDRDDRRSFWGLKFLIFGYFSGRKLFFFGWFDFSTYFLGVPVFKTIWRFIVKPAYPSRIVLRIRYHQTCFKKIHFLCCIIEYFLDVYKAR